jgi:hypothetical protein
MAFEGFVKSTANGKLLYYLNNPIKLPKFAALIKINITCMHLSQAPPDLLVSIW